MNTQAESIEFLQNVIQKSGNTVVLINRKRLKNQDNTEYFDVHCIIQDGERQPFSLWLTPNVANALNLETRQYQNDPVLVIDGGGFSKSGEIADSLSNTLGFLVHVIELAGA